MAILSITVSNALAPDLSKSQRSSYLNLLEIERIFSSQSVRLSGTSPLPSTRHSRALDSHTTRAHTRHRLCDKRQPVRS
jgi:hypothetical protein